VTQGARGLRWHALAALTLAVVALHWITLQQVAPVFAPARAVTTAPLQIRTVPHVQAPQAEPSGAAAVSPNLRAPRVPTAVPAAPSGAEPDVSPVSAAVGAITAPIANAGPKTPGELPGAASSPRASPASPASRAPQAASVQPLEPSAPLTATLAVAVPGSATFHYRATSRLRGAQVDGHAVLHWQQDGSSYDATLALTLPGRPTRTQRSAGAITVHGLSPLRYSDRSRSEEAAHFDRDGGRIVFSANRPAALMHPGAQDRLSVLLQLSAWAAGNPSAFTASRSILVQTAGTREAVGWKFDIESAERLDLPGGAVEALRLTRPALHEHDASLELWLGPGPAYAPVRLRLTGPGGDWLDLQWSGTDRG
jgi:hypothetical protein